MLANIQVGLQHISTRSASCCGPILNKTDVFFFSSFIKSAQHKLSQSPFFFGAFAKLRKATFSFVKSVCMFVRMELLGSHSMDFLVTWLFSENLSRKFRFHWSVTRITGTLHEGQYTFWSYPTQIFLERKMFQTKLIEKIRTQIWFQ